MDHLCYFCIVFVMLTRLLITALWSPAGKGLTSWLSFVVLNWVVVTFPFGILGQVCYLIVSIPDLCPFLTFILYAQYYIYRLFCSSDRCNRPEFPPSQFFPRGKNGPAHSFPGEKVGRPILSPPSQFFPPNNFKNHNGIIISLHKFKKPLLN